MKAFGMENNVTDFYERFMKAGVREACFMFSDTRVFRQIIQLPIFMHCLRPATDPLIATYFARIQPKSIPFRGLSYLKRSRPPWRTLNIVSEVNSAKDLL